MPELICPECKSTNGMMAVDRAGVRNFPTLPYWRSVHVLHHVFTPCPRCNPVGPVPLNYYYVSPAWLRIWDSTPCTCADCRRERQKTA